MADGHGGARPRAGRPPGAKDSKPRKRPIMPIRPPLKATPKVEEKSYFKPRGDKAVTSFQDVVAMVERLGAQKKSRKRSVETTPFRIPEHPREATPPRGGMAQDSALCASNAWATQDWIAGGAFTNTVSEGLLFLGYPYLAELAQRPEYRTFSDTIATEMTRKWIKFKGIGDDKTEKIKQLVDFLDSLETRDKFKELATQDGYFGRGHLFLDVGADIDGDPAELASPIGNGRDGITTSKITKGNGLRRLQTVEAVWTYPQVYNSNNPLKKDWYNPQQWFVMGKEIHCSRLLTLIGRPVPDLLKPAYSFGGLSLSQIAQPYVNIWLQTRESIGQMLHSFSVMVLHTNLQTTLAPGHGAGLMARAALFNLLRDNQGLFVVNKDTEDFKNVSAPLGGLHELQAQAQEHMMCCQKGTLVETNRGQVPIEKVTSEDQVMTRFGLAPVHWVGQTGMASELVEIQIENSTLRVTGWHPIWSETTHEFVNAESVDHSHRLLRSTKWGNTAHQSLGAAAGGGKPRPDITETKRLAASFIEKSMRFMSDLSRMVSTSIMSMMIRLTTASLTSSFSLAPITINGTSRRMGESASTVTSRRSSNVSFAETSLLPLCQSEASTAHQPARARSGTAVEIAKVSVIEGLREPVYNLEVACGFLPEFYANGILVHNSVARIPAVKFTGIQPMGLSASSEGEIRVFYDTISSYQNALFRPKLNVVVDMAMITLWGERDPEITYDFEPLWELSEKEKSEKRKMDADTGQVHIDSGVIRPEEERTRIINDPESAYQGLDPEDVPDLDLEEESGLEPIGGRPDPKAKGEGDKEGGQGEDAVLPEAMAQAEERKKTIGNG